LAVWCHVMQNIQSLPLMRTTHECTQEVSREGIISSSSCQEQHTFRPFAKHHNGATTEVSYTLTFSKMTAGVKTRASKFTIYSSNSYRAWKLETVLLIHVFV
jgi:hypothetical protein